MSHQHFGTVINCMDGRVQLPVIIWLKKKYGLDYVDSITEPGMDGVIASATEPELARIMNKVLLSHNVHGSKLVAIIGHHDCAGNPVSKEQHLSEIARSVGIIASWGIPMVPLGLWVNERWKVEIIMK